MSTWRIGITNTPFDICEVDAIRDLLLPHHEPQTTPVPTAGQCMERLRAIPRLQHAAIEGCSEEEIDRLEEQLGVNLPAAYREFLSRMGKGLGEFMVSVVCCIPCRIQRSAQASQIQARDSGQRLVRSKTA